MFTNKEIYKIAMEQSAIDSNCKWEDFLKKDNVVVISDRAPPSLRVLSLQLTAVSRANTNQMQVNAAAVSVYDSIAADRATEPRFQNPIQSCSVHLSLSYLIHSGFVL